MMIRFLYLSLVLIFTGCSSFTQPKIEVSIADNKQTQFNKDLAFHLIINGFEIKKNSDFAVVVQALSIQEDEIFRNEFNIPIEKQYKANIAYKIVLNGQTIQAFDKVFYETISVDDGVANNDYFTKDSVTDALHYAIFSDITSNLFALHKSK